MLPGGIDGSLCLYTYEEQTTDSDGNRQTTYIHFTIAMTELPDTAAYLGELYCQRRVGFRFMDGMEDVFRKRQRVEQESEAVDSSYEIFIGERDDMNRARQILSPAFLVWLEQNSDENFAFELVAGSLVSNVKGHKKLGRGARRDLRGLGGGRAPPPGGGGPGDRAVRAFRRRPSALPRRGRGQRRGRRQNGSASAVRSATTQSPPAARNGSTPYSPVATLTTLIPAPCAASTSSGVSPTAIDPSRSSRPPATTAARSSALRQTSTRSSASEP